MGEMINTLGRPPARWWDTWISRRQLSRSAGRRVSDFSQIATPTFRPLHQRLWEIGRGETSESCEWNVAGGELKALEDALRCMLAFEPVDRSVAEQWMTSDYMRNWALPAWEKHMKKMQSMAE